MKLHPKVEAAVDRFGFCGSGSLLPRDRELVQAVAAAQAEVDAERCEALAKEDAETENLRTAIDNYNTGCEDCAAAIRKGD